MAKAKRKGKKKSPMGKFKRYLYPVVLILLVGVTFVLVKFGISLFHASKTIENLPEKMAQLRAEPSKIFSADGKLLYTSSEQYRLPVELGEVPPKLRDAVLVAEDKRFYEHQGVDPVGIGRALFNLGKKGGGSTLTMQLSKQLYTSTERSLDRKLNDIALAVMMERRMTKDEIFQLYLNQVYFGSGAYGIKAAAEVFFGKSLDALTLGESALLARCVRLPSTQNPLTNPEAALANRDVVLALLRNEGKISEKEYESALREKLRLKPNPKVTQAKIHAAPYAVQHVLQVLRETRPDIDLNEGGYRIDTTINAEIQEDAEQAVQSLVRRYRRGKVNWGAFLLMDRQGRILAEVGGADYKLNQFNVVSMGKRQPGSAFKPFVYATALANGDLDPDESLSNERHTWRIPGGKPWTPENSNGKYSGRMSVEYAFKHSVNVPAVHVIDKTGPDHVVAYASQVFGFKSRLDPVLPLALGSSAVSPLEMAQAYSVFQSGGDRATPFIISRIQGPEGVLGEYQPEIIPQVLPAPVAANIDRYMRAVVESGTGTRAASVTGARGKTGTTSDNRDAWFCGYTDDLIGIGWVANMRYVADREPPWVYGEMSSRVFGGTVTVQLWTEVMRKAERMISRGKLIPPGERKTNTERRREPESEPVEDVPIETPAEPARDPYQQPIDSMPPMNQVPLDPPQPQDDSSVPLNGPPGVDGEPPIKTGGPGT